jgi:hypothetical protein
MIGQRRCRPPLPFSLILCIDLGSYAFHYDKLERNRYGCTPPSKLLLLPSRTPLLELDRPHSPAVELLLQTVALPYFSMRWTWYMTNRESVTAAPVILNLGPSGGGGGA